MVQSKIKEERFAGYGLVFRWEWSESYFLRRRVEIKLVQPLCQWLYTSEQGGSTLLQYYRVPIIRTMGS